MSRRSFCIRWLLCFMSCRIPLFRWCLVNGWCVAVRASCRRWCVVFISPGDVSYLFLFLSSSSMLSGNFQNEKFWIIFAALSRIVCLAMNFGGSKKSGSASIDESYWAWSHLTLATSFKSFSVNSFRNMDSTCLNVTSFDMVSFWKSSVACWCSNFKKFVFPHSSVNLLLNGLKWLWRRCSNTLNRPLLSLKVGTCVCRDFVFVA